MEAKATLHYLRIAPRKVRLLADLVRGKSVSDAETQLSVATKGATGALLKLLKSAKAGAKERGMNSEKIYIKSITVDGGPVLKRYRPRAFGRAGEIRKRTSHITVVLGER